MQKWVPWIIIALSVLGGIGLFIWNYLQPDEDEEEGLEGDESLALSDEERAKKGDDPFATTTEEYRGGGARKSRMMAMMESFEKSLDSKEGATVTSKDHMRMPWFLLVGADGSGKKTVLANNGLPLPFGPPLHVDPNRKDAGKWWKFDDAVVLEAPAAAPGPTAGAQTLPPGQTVADTSIGWQTLLHVLRRERPDSPLNGIIVTISCADLLSGRANPEKLNEQAERIRNFLERTRKALGVRLPLHIIVTKCDALPGFRSFADTLPEDRRHDIFGWANPNDIETKFDPAWIDAGFEALKTELAGLRDELLAAPEQVGDPVGLFVFDTEFPDMHEPLKEFVSKLMTDGERRPSLFFRGMYFTGDTIDHTPPATADAPGMNTVRISAETTVGDQPHNLVFLRSLFAEKIFKEAGLARPTARFRLARDRRVVVAQAAAVLLLVGGTFGLWTSLYGFQRGEEIINPGLRSDAEQLTRVLSGLAIDLDQVARASTNTESVLDRRANDAAVIELVGQMRDVPTSRMRSPFLPTSWFSPLPNDIHESMLRGVQRIVLPVTRQRLLERADRLLGFRNGVQDTSLVERLDASDPKSLSNYLRDVRTLSLNIARYNSLADARTGTVRELSQLLDYLFGERLSTDSGLSSSEFETALRQGAAPKIVISPAMANSVINRAVVSVTEVASAAGAQLAPRTSAAAEKAINPEQDLQALFGLHALVDLVDPRTGLVAAVSDSAILGVRLARAIQDSVDAQLRFAAARIRRDTLSPIEAADSLKRVIGDVFKLRLMAPREGREIVSELRPNQRLRWDVGRLELALGLRGEFTQAVVAVATAFPGQPPDRLRRALEVQLRGRAVDVAASAQRFTEGSGESILDIRTQGSNLDAASTRIVRLAVLLDSLNAGNEGRKLLASGGRQAIHAIAMAQSLVETQRYFAPQTAKVASWQGIFPIAYAALGVNDSLLFETTLINQTTDVRTLAREVTPALKYLRLRTIDTTHISKLVADWEEFAASVSRYERGDYTSSVGLLQRFLRERMSVTDLTSCAAMVAQPDTTKPAGDLFTLRRRQFFAAMAGRCGGASADAVAAYARLRQLFTARLAGRFPFADSTQIQRAADVDLGSLREFLKQYDAFTATSEVSLRSDPSLVTIAKPATEFLDQVSQVRAFLSPMLETDRALPRYSLLIHHGDEDREALWQYGDSLHVATTFDSLGNEKRTYAKGGWAPLRYLLVQRDSTVSIKFFHPETKIERMLPLFPSAAPDIVPPKAR